MDHLGETITGIPGLHVPLHTDLKSQYVSCNFHLFPVKNGWEIDKHGHITCNRNLGPPDSRDHRWIFERFAQRWLFFEVLKAVLGQDPGFSYKHFASDDGQWVRTTALRGYLERWEHRERSEENAAKRVSRMIRVIQVLNSARDYVSNHCAVSNAKENSRWAINPVISLSFMVLGETLTRAMIRIQQATDFKVQGWHNHDPTSQGWGYSKAVLEELEKRGWCPKTIHMLQSLFRGNTIGLLYAIPFAHDGRFHFKCSATECLAPAKRTANAIRSIQEKSASRKDSPEYPYHHYEKMCPDKSKCRKVGPEAVELARVLDAGMVPVLHYDRESAELKVVEMAHWKQDYAIFSHVWADGFGNPHENKIYECNLKLFSELFDNLRTDSNPHLGPPGSDGAQNVDTLFWIDTLAIPVGDAFKAQKKKAIEKMHDIYTHARYTIVLDTGLMQKSVEPDYAGPAMHITMSAWMTRLWTLQEAVLSRHLYFNFNNRLCSMDRLEEQFYREDRAIHTCVPAIARAYYHGIMGTERYQLHYTSVPVERRRSKASFVGEVWKAAQWRTTAYPHHETLSLATLLNVKAGDFVESTDQDQDQTILGRKLEERMRSLLVLLAESNPCAIPAGMIFLPGPKLNYTGFGWAPRTWLSSQEVLSPDPLALNVPDSILHPHGLEVQFPGFMLHHLLDQGYCLEGHDEFYFPTDLQLLEWYHVQRDERDDAPFPADNNLKDRRLAIIASSLPVIHGKVIALLVVVIKSPGDRHDVQILNRVWLSRESYSPSQADAAAVVNDWRTNFRKEIFTKMPCGERLPPSQKWCVDGPPLWGNSESDFIPPPPVRSASSWSKGMWWSVLSSPGRQRAASMKASP